MPRTKTTVMALLAGVALIGAAANADAASSTPPLVLDNAALDTVTAGNFQVGMRVLGQAIGGGTRFGSAEVQQFVQAQGNGTGGAALGVIGALGFGVGDPEVVAATRAQPQGNLLFTRDFHKSLNGFFEFSASVGWSASAGAP